MRYPASDDIILYQHMCDITFDQSPHSIFVCCQALVVFLNFGVFRVFALVISPAEAACKESSVR